MCAIRGHIRGIFLSEYLTLHDIHDIWMCPKLGDGLSFRSCHFNGEKRLFQSIFGVLHLETKPLGFARPRNCTCAFFLTQVVDVRWFTISIGRFNHSHPFSILTKL
jgi:hypothetical protein